MAERCPVRSLESRGQPWLDDQMQRHKTSLASPIRNDHLHDVLYLQLDIPVLACRLILLVHQDLLLSILFLGPRK